VKKPALPHPAVVVEWTDSAYCTGEVDMASLPEPKVIRSAGWLLRRDADSLTVAQESHEGGEAFRLVMTIPAVNVRKVRRLS
jgi:hypothetical protein